MVGNPTAPQSLMQTGTVSTRSLLDLLPETLQFTTSLLMVIHGVTRMIRCQDSVV